MKCTLAEKTVDSAAIQMRNATNCACRFAILSLLTAAALGTVCTQAALDITYDFEGTEPTSYWRDYARTSITYNPAEVISGNASLKFDMSSGTPNWYILFKTLTSGVPLTGGKRYEVSFKYDIVGLDNSDAYFYFMARAESWPQRPDKGWFPFRESWPDKRHYRNIVLADASNDYQISLGVYWGGTLILDDIRIRQLPDIDVTADGLQVSDASYEPYGVCTHLDRLPAWGDNGFTDEQVTQSLQLLANAGVQWIRVGVPWFIIESYQDVMYEPQLSRIDLILDTAANYDIKVHLQLGGQPGWVSENPSASNFWAYAPVDMNEWGDFVEMVGFRFSDRVDYWEISNEVDWGFWVSELSKYVQYLQIAYDKLKAIDADNQIILAGLAFDGIHVWQIAEGAEEHALKKLYSLGAKNYFDILAIHPYVIEAEHGTIESIDSINTAYEIMRANDDGDKHIWLTEIGRSTCGDPAKLAEQALYLETIYTELIKHPKVDKVYWYNFRCKAGEGDCEDNFGIVNNDFTLRPAYNTLAALPKSADRFVNYDFIPNVLQIDIDGNGTINFYDLGLLTNNWLFSDCSFPGWCEQTDLSHDGIVNLLDFQRMADYWQNCYHQ